MDGWMDGWMDMALWSSTGLERIRWMDSLLTWDVWMLDRWDAGNSTMLIALLLTGVNDALESSARGYG